MSIPIVTVTLNPSIDRSLQVEQVVPGRKLKARRDRRDPGGGGINVARAILRLGGEALALWSKGGPTGEQLATLLRDENVSERAIEIGGTTRENVVVGEASTDQEYRFGVSGPALTSGELDKWVEAVASIDEATEYVVLSGSLPPQVPDDFYATLIASVRSKTARLVLDTKGRVLDRGLDAHPWMVKPNLRELGDLVGRNLESDEDVEDAAHALRTERGIEVVLVSLGRGGAFLATSQGAQHLRAPTVRARSRVGAGDSMVGGLVLGLAQGRSVEEAARLGIAAGAAAVMSEGTELCRGEDAWRLYHTMTREAALPTEAAQT